MKKRSQRRPKRRAEVVSFRRLKVGDWIRITAIPAVFLRPGHCFPRVTRQLYERLIRLRRKVKVIEIDDSGYPWISYRHRDAKKGMVWHGLMITHDDVFVRVLRAGERLGDRR